MKLLHSDVLQIGIDGTLYEVDEVRHLGYLPMVSAGGKEYYVAQNCEQAGEAAREYWQDLAENDAKEFACLVGQDTLIAWALGQSAGPGSTCVHSLDEWLDLTTTCPEEHFASYDMYENEITAMSTGLFEELGWFPQLDWDQIIEDAEITEKVNALDLAELGLVEYEGMVAYRHN